MSTTCQVCGGKSELFLCMTHMQELHKLLGELPWILDRLAETAVGQAKLGEPGGRRQHKAGLERYADPKPALDGKGGTEGQRRLEKDLEDQKFRNRLLSQGGVNAKASDLFDEVQNMLSGWARDVCERRGLYWIPDPTFIGPLKANEMRYAPRTASRMAIWLKERVTALASAECASETFEDVKSATEQMVRAVNRPPEPKTCGPCPTTGVMTDKGFVIDAHSRSKCGTRLEVRESASEVRCPVCKQTHIVDDLTNRLVLDMHYMSFTIKQLVDVVIPKAQLDVKRRTLYDWVKHGKLKATGEDENGTPRYMLADVKMLRMERKTA